MSIHTYKGYFQNGLFVPSEPISIPENTPVYVVVDEEPVFDNFQPRKPINEKVAAIRKIFADIDAIKDEDNVLSDADWDELANLRSHKIYQG